MNTPLKYTLIGIGAVVGAVVIAAGAFIASFDPNAWKAEAAQAVKDATGRELAIPGDIQLELFPWLALRTGRVELGNAPGFAGPFATIERFEARVKFASLFKGDLEIGAITLDGVDIALAVDAQGRDNWSDLGGAKGGAADGTPVEAAAASSAPARGWTAAGLTLADARLAYSDARSGATYDVSDLDVAIGAIAPGQPIRIDGSAAFAQAGATPLKGRVGFGAKVVPGDTTVVEGLALSLDAEGGPLPAPLAGGTLDIERLALGEATTLEGFAFKGYGLELTGALKQATVDGASVLTGRLESAMFSPRDVFPKLGIAIPQTADPKALTAMRFAFDLDQRGDALTLDKLAIELDQSKVTGRVALESIARTALRFDLALDAIDADRYLAPPAPAPEGASAPPGGGIAAVKLETGWLKGLDVAGTLRAGKLAVAKVDVADLRASLEARNGVLRLKPFGAALYGGKVQGEAALDARGATPIAQVKLALAGLKIDALLEDAFNSKMVSGVAKLDLDLAGRGATVGAIKQSLDGTARFAVEDGALNGFNVWKQVRLAWAKLKSKQTPAASDPDRTEFEVLTGGATVAAGVATLEDVRAAIRFAEVTAKGRVDLVRDVLAINAKARIVEAPEFGPGENLTDLKGATLPVEITGPFAKPKVDVDVTKAATSLLKPSLLKDEKLKKKLKGLF